MKPAALIRERLPKASRALGPTTDVGQSGSGDCPGSTIEDHTDTPRLAGKRRTPQTRNPTQQRRTRQPTSEDMDAPGTALIVGYAATVLGPGSCDPSPTGAVMGLNKPAARCPVRGPMWAPDFSAQAGAADGDAARDMRGPDDRRSPDASRPARRAASRSSSRLSSPCDQELGGPFINITGRGPRDHQPSAGTAMSHGPDDQRTSEDGSGVPPTDAARSRRQLVQPTRPLMPAANHAAPTCIASDRTRLATGRYRGDILRYSSSLTGAWPPHASGSVE
jgi:hypothetical protein